MRSFHAILMLSALTLGCGSSSFFGAKEEEASVQGGGRFTLATTSQPLTSSSISKAICPLLRTTYYSANQKVAPRIPTSPFGWFVFQQMDLLTFNGINPSYRVSNLRGVTNNDGRVFTTNTYKLFGADSNIGVVEPILGASQPSSALADIHTAFEETRSDCPIYGFSPLSITGTDLPQQDDGITVEINLKASGSLPGCRLFRLPARYYSYVGYLPQTGVDSANVEIPPFSSEWSLLSNSSGLETNEVGQLNPAVMGSDVCSSANASSLLDLGGRETEIRVGSLLRPMPSTYSNGFKYAQSEWLKRPTVIAHVCVTPRTIWEQGYIHPDCLCVPTPQNTCDSGDLVNAQEGDVVMLVGEFPLEQRPPTCLNEEGALCPQPRMAIRSEISIGGVTVDKDLGKIWSSMEGTTPINTSIPYELHLDFNNDNATSSTVTQDAPFVAFPRENSFFNYTRRYGYVTSPNASTYPYGVASADRGNGPSPSKLTRDFHRGGANTEFFTTMAFRALVPNGTYQVRIRRGDNSWHYPPTKGSATFFFPMRVTEIEQNNVVTLGDVPGDVTDPGSIIHDKTFSNVVVTDGAIDLTFQTWDSDSDGGTNECNPANPQPNCAWGVNALEIIQTTVPTFHKYVDFDDPASLTTQPGWISFPFNENAPYNGSTKFGYTKSDWTSPSTSCGDRVCGAEVRSRSSSDALLRDFHRQNNHNEMNPMYFMFGELASGTYRVKVYRGDTDTASTSFDWPMEVRENESPPNNYLLLAGQGTPGTVKTDEKLFTVTDGALNLKFTSVGCTTEAKCKWGVNAIEVERLSQTPDQVPAPYVPRISSGQDLTDCNPTPDSTYDAPTCSRVMVKMPLVRPQTLPAWISFVAKDPLAEADRLTEYGSNPALLGESGVKIVYIGGPGQLTAARPPAPVLSIVETTTHSATISFTHVPDDPSGAGLLMPVSRYVITRPNGNVFDALPRPIPGQAPGTVQNFTLDRLADGTSYCMAMQAIDSAGNPSLASNTICPTTLSVLNQTSLPPCQANLHVSENPALPGQITLKWNEPSRRGFDDPPNGCQNRMPSGATASLYQILSYQLKYKVGQDFLDTDFGPSLPDVSTLPGVVDLGIRDPGSEHTVTLNLPQRQNFFFALKTCGDLACSTISNHISARWDPPQISMGVTGQGQFIDMRKNYPTDLNVAGRRLLAGAKNYTLPHVSEQNHMDSSSLVHLGHPWILAADQEKGPRIFKFADHENSICVKYLRDSNPGNDCSAAEWDKAIDRLPVVGFADDDPNRPVGDPDDGDGFADLIEKDMHGLRYGLNDCTEPFSQPTPAPPIDELRYRDLASCNLPQVRQKYSATNDIAVGRVNADNSDDIVLAVNANNARDGVYISTGQDLCPTYADGSARVDFPDGIPCFHNPIDLPPPDPTRKRQKRVKLYKAREDGYGADLLFFIDHQGSIVTYSNNCKTRLGACATGELENSDFTPINNNILTSVAQGSHPFSSLHCADIAFLDLNTDAGGNIKDMICIRSTGNGNPNEGVDLFFKATMPNPDGLPIFQEDPSLRDRLPTALQNLNCNGSFIETATDSSQLQYLLIGYKKPFTNQPEPGCATQFLVGMAGSNFVQKNLAGLNGSENCNGAAFGDLRNVNAMDLAIACGNPWDMTSDPEAGSGFRGAKVYLQDQLGEFQLFESDDNRKIYQEAFPPERVNGSLIPLPLIVPFTPFFRPVNFSLAATPTNPGAFSNVSMGDMDGDGVNDLFFGNNEAVTGLNSRNASLAWPAPLMLLQMTNQRNYSCRDSRPDLCREPVWTPPPDKKNRYTP